MKLETTLIGTVLGIPLCLFILILTLLSFPKPAECIFCATAPCRTNLECLPGCACAIATGQTFGVCTDVR